MIMPRFHDGRRYSKSPSSQSQKMIKKEKLQCVSSIQTNLYVPTSVAFN